MSFGSRGRQDGTLAFEEKDETTKWRDGFTLIGIERSGRGRVERTTIPDASCFGAQNAALSLFWTLSTTMRERSGYSGKLVVEVDHLPNDEDYIVNQINPRCPGEDNCPSTDARLCDTCWFREFVNTDGIETVVEGVTWEGKGEKEVRLRITGHMRFEATNSIEYGWEYDEEFEVEKVEVLPEPTCY
jgi:hypothetical protein